jgi:Transglutaminase-like superfamily
MTVPHGQSFVTPSGRVLIPYAAAPTPHDVTRHDPSSRRSSEASEPAVRWWSVAACMVSIALVRRSLAWWGFARTLRRIRDRSERASTTTDPAPSIIAMVDRVVALAAALYPGRALCLERSLVLYDRLRREGAAVELRIGVQATPFAAHAWVTYRGEPVNDSAEHVAHFVVMPEPRP